MKKIDKFKELITIISLSILLCSGCSPTPQAPAEPEVIEIRTEKKTDANITIPSILIGDELSQIQTDDTVVENDNGTVTYSLKGEEIDSILKQISENISGSIQDILDNDEYYPNITAITPSDNYATFTISLTDGQMNMYESMLVMSFYTIGNRYQIYNGIPAEEAVTTVIYINAEDDSVISKTDSTSVENFTPQ